MEKEADLFVYGTLRQQMSHPLGHLLIRQGKFLGLGIFQGKLYDLGRYPGVVPSKDKTHLVTGEVYRLNAPDRVLGLLDEYEGPRFKRTRVTVFFGPDGHLPCWIYLYTRSVHSRRIILSGDYVQFRNAS
jgi:pyruvate carboxylase